VGFVAHDHSLYKEFIVADLLNLGREWHTRWEDSAGEAPAAAAG
jgi:hypothetical protein